MQDVNCELAGTNCRRSVGSGPYYRITHAFVMSLVAVFTLAAASPGMQDYTAGAFRTIAPGLNTLAEGDRLFYVDVEAGDTLTVDVQVKQSGITGNPPQLIIAGDSITDQTDTALAAVGTWEKLSVGATPAVREVLTIIMRARNSAGTCYFSDPTVTVRTG